MAEERLDRAMRSVPMRRAPASLESRVLSEIERRAALPWWRHSFAQWPGVARAAFLITCGALAVLALTGGLWAVASIGSAHTLSALPPPWARQTVALVGVAGELFSTLVRVIPQDWLYGGLAASAVLYAALFGLSIAAYRVLYLRTEAAGDFSS